MHYPDDDPDAARRRSDVPTALHELLLPRRDVPCLCLRRPMRRMLHVVVWVHLLGVRTDADPDELRADPDANSVRNE